MKKLIIIFLLSFIASYSFAQSDTLYPQPPQNLGGLNVAVRDTGGLLVRQTMVAPVYNDTTAANAANPYTKSYTASIIYTRDVKAYWFRQDNPRKWVIMGSSNGNNNIDTIFTKIPIFVDTVSSPGRRILTLLHLNGLESGGVVTLDSCMTIDVTPAIYYLNYRQYTTALVIGLALEPADAFDRTDAVVVDSNLNVRIKKGLAGNIAPYINPSSEVLLANIPVPANATCLSITQEIIFDGVGDNASQWTNSTTGTITAAFTNTTYPFHLLQDLYVQTYTDSSQIIFTKPSGTDTVKSTSILKIPISVNGAFTNQIQGQWFNGSTAVSNNIVLNPYFNPNDSNFYQLLVAPFNIWNFSSIVYNKLVLSFAGQDIAGGKGLYMDYIQIQTGVMNNNPFLVLTTNGTSGAATYDNLSHVLNIPVYSGGGGSETFQNTLDNGSSLDKDNVVIVSGNNFEWNNFDIYNFDSNIPSATFAVTVNNSPISGSFQLLSNEALLIVGDATTDNIQNKIDANTGSVAINSVNNTTSTQSLFSAQPSSAFIVVGNNAGAQAGYVATLIDSASGQFNWQPASGGGGDGLANFYLKDSSLPSDRTVDLNGSFLSFNQDGDSWMKIDPPSGDIDIISRNSTGAIRSAELELFTDDTRSYGNLFISGDNGTHSSYIQLDANASVSSIELSSETVEIEGSIIYNTPISGAVTDSVLTIDPSTHAINWRDAASFGGNQTLQDVINNGNDLSTQSNDIRLGNGSVYYSMINNLGHTQLFLDPGVEYNIGDNGSDYGMGSIDINTIDMVINPSFTNLKIYASPISGNPDSIYGVGSDRVTHLYPFSIGRYVHSIFTPTTGGTVNLVNNQYNILNPAGALLAVTVNLPSSPIDNDAVFIKFTKAVTTVTYSNGTVVDGIASPVAGGLVVLTYDSGSSSWY